jgi:hypothetical protein
VGAAPLSRLRSRPVAAPLQSRRHRRRGQPAAWRRATWVHAGLSAYANFSHRGHALSTRLSVRGAMWQIRPRHGLSMSHVLVCWTPYVIPRSVFCDEESHAGTRFERGRGLDARKAILRLHHGITLIESMNTQWKDLSEDWQDPAPRATGVVECPRESSGRWLRKAATNVPSAAPAQIIFLDNRLIRRERCEEPVDSLLCWPVQGGLGECSLSTRRLMCSAEPIATSSRLDIRLALRLWLRCGRTSCSGSNSDNQRPPGSLAAFHCIHQVPR